MVFLVVPKKKRNIKNIHLERFLFGLTHKFFQCVKLSNKEKMPMDMYAHEREWLKYRIIKETSAYMVADIAGLIATYCMPADAPKTIESAQAVKGCAIRLDPMTEQRFASKYGFHRRAAPQPEPPQMDMWGEPVAKPYEASEPYGIQMDMWGEPVAKPYECGGANLWPNRTKPSSEPYGIGGTMLQ
jgi:hypothetical protein